MKNAEFLRKIQPKIEFSGCPGADEADFKRSALMFSQRFMCAGFNLDLLGL